MQQRYSQNKQLMWANALTLSWQLITHSSHVYSLTYLLHSEHCPLIPLRQPNVQFRFKLLPYKYVQEQKGIPMN